MIHSSESWWKIVLKLLCGRTKNRCEIPMISKYSVFVVGTRRINSTFRSIKFSVPLTSESVTSGQAGGVFRQLFFQCWLSSSTLGDFLRRGQQLQEGEHQRGLGEASYCGLCLAKTVRRCFCAWSNILLTHMFYRNCLRLGFFGSHVLSTPIFCRRLYFVNA